MDPWNPAAPSIARPALTGKLARKALCEYSLWYPIVILHPMGLQNISSA